MRTAYAYLVRAEEGRLLYPGAHVAEAGVQAPLHVLPAAQKVGHPGHHLLAVGHLAQVRGARRQPSLLHAVHAEAQEVRRALLLPELHVAHLGDGLGGVLLVRGRRRVQRHHLLVQVRARRGVVHLALEERARAHLDVDHVRVHEAVQQVLQLDEGVVAVRDAAVIPGHEAAQGGVLGEGVVG